MEIPVARGQLIMTSNLVGFPVILKDQAECSCSDSMIIFAINKNVGLFSGCINAMARLSLVQPEEPSPLRRHSCY